MTLFCLNITPRTVDKRGANIDPQFDKVWLSSTSMYVDRVKVFIYLDETGLAIELSGLEERPDDLWDIRGLVNRDIPKLARWCVLLGVILKKITMYIFSVIIC